VSELLQKEKIESRTYQEVIAASASDSNTLVVLPTGLGKTMIAAMVASMKLKYGKVLFLAPTRPLVEQHKKTFEEFLKIGDDDFKVMTGKTKPEERAKLWKEKKAFFATPQVVENDLISKSIPIEDFELVIFDEAHRATGDYSYVFISEKMHCQKLALTASPGGNKEKIMEVANNLDLENFEVRTDDDPDVEPYIEEKEINWEKVELDNRFQQARNDLEAAKKNMLKKLKNMGKINSVNNVHKGDLLQLRGEISSELSQSEDKSLYKAISLVASAIKISQAIELLETQGISQCYDYVQGLENDDSKAASKVLNDKDFQSAKSMIEYLKKEQVEHPKQEKLAELLELSGDEKAIVFTEYRKSADKIVERLEKEGFNAKKFVGQQGDDGMSQTEQIDVLAEFDDGKHNVLVSTSVGEEGLDIPAVDYVIFYEPVSSGIRDIQRAGRTGRQESGNVIVLMAENTRDEGHYWSSHHKKKRMNSVLEELKEEGRKIEEKAQETLKKYDKKDEKSEKDQIIVYADDRENEVNKELSRLDIKVETERLEVGDFLVSEETAVERKTAEDLVDSIVDNRLFPQLNELIEFENPLIVIEGRDLYSHRDVHPNSIRGAIASITIDYGVPIIWSEGVEETAKILRSLAKREQKEKEKEVAVRGEKSPKQRKEIQEFIVAGIPSINTKMARRLLDNFGSVENVYNATFEELKEVEGIGEKTAADIREILEADYDG